jgi:hypothetical protein
MLRLVLLLGLLDELRKVEEIGRGSAMIVSCPHEKVKKEWSDVV